MTSVINAMRAMAREDEAEAASLPADAVPALSEAARAGITDQILRAQARERREQEPQGDGQPGGLARDSSTDAVGLRREARARSRRGFVFTAGGLGLVAAAAAMLILARAPSDNGGPLPAYGVSASGGVAELRGGRPEAAEADATTTTTTTAPAQRLRAESELRVICRPDNAVAGPVAVRAFFVQGEDVDEVRPTVQVAATGATELRLRGADLLPRHHGTGSLRVVVGRPDVVRAIDPGAAKVASSDKPGAQSDRDSSRPDRRWLTVPLDLEIR